MTVLEQVQTFLEKRTPQPVCDDCIAVALELSVRQHANIKTRQLQGHPAFHREKNVCSICGAEKKVIRSKG